MMLFNAKTIVFGVVGLLFLSLVYGCAFHSEYLLSNPELSEPELLWSTKPIIIIADTQFHEDTGTASRTINPFADWALTNVTLRTVQQNYGVSEILREVLQQANGKLVLHLGDVLNVSCLSEKRAFDEIVKSFRKNLVITAGNHDGYLVGNDNPKFNSCSLFEYPNPFVYKRYHWTNLCAQGRNYNEEEFCSNSTVHFGKDDVTRWIASGAGYSIIEGSGVSWKSSIEAGGSVCIAWHLESDSYGKAPWKSYLLQLVRLPGPEHTPVYMLVIDTSSFDTAPGLWFNNAVNGDFRIDQIIAAKKIINKLPHESRIILGGHHPLSDWKTDKWSDKKKSMVSDLLADSRILPFYVSAHSHEGGWFESNLVGHRIIELNTGSLIDAPIYYRDLKIGQTHDGKFVVGSRVLWPVTDCKFDPTNNEEAHSIENQSNSIESWKYLLGIWKAKHRELEAYLSYQAELVRKYVISESLEPKITWRWDNEACKQAGDNNVKGCSKIDTKSSLLALIRDQLTCDDGSNYCTAWGKANLVIDIRKKLPKLVKDKSKFRKDIACQAVSASEIDAELAGDKNRVLQIKKRIEAEWCSL